MVVWRIDTQLPVPERRPHTHPSRRKPMPKLRKAVRNTGGLKVTLVEATDLRICIAQEENSERQPLGVRAAFGDG